MFECEDMFVLSNELRLHYVQLFYLWLFSEEHIYFKYSSKVIQDHNKTNAFEMRHNL